MSKTQFWQIAPYLLAVLSYLLGRQRNKLRMPKSLDRLMQSKDVLDIIAAGIDAAQGMAGKSDTEKREYVRSWAKSELYKLLGEWLPDSVLNLLIEHMIARRRA